MRRTSLTLMAVLAVVAGACGDDRGPRVLDLDALRIHKVAGDGQVEPVASTAPLAAAIPAGLSAQVSDAGDLFEQVLVVRLAEEGKMTLSGATVKPGTMIHWEVRGEGCGKPVGASTVVDDSAYSINRWRKGTKAGECLMDACRILADGTVHCDETFVAVQEPGPVADVYMVQVTSGLPPMVAIGDTLDGRDFVPYGWDKHRNKVPGDVIGTLPDSLVTWTLSDNAYVTTADPIHGQGWDIVVPSLDGWYVNTHDPGIGPHYRVRLQVFIEGAETTESSYFIVPIDS